MLNYTLLLLKKRQKLALNEKGAEMVEYALVLACIAAIGAFMYTVYEGTSGAYFKVELIHLWEKIGLTINSMGI